MATQKKQTESLTSFSKGDVLMREGDPSGDLWIIRTGSVGVFRERHGKPNLELFGQALGDREEVQVIVDLLFEHVLLNDVPGVGKGRHVALSEVGNIGCQRCRSAALDF